MEKSTISVKELSTQMGISLTKAYALVKTRGFPVLYIGNKILITMEAYRKWLTENTQNQ